MTLEQLIEKWRADSRMHEQRAEEARSAGDEVNFQRQDAYAYAAQLHADKLESLLKAGALSQQEQTKAGALSRAQEPISDDLIRDLDMAYMVGSDKERYDGLGRAIMALKALRSLSQSSREPNGGKNEDDTRVDLER